MVAGGEAYRGTYPNGQILKSKGKERYPQWLESQEEHRAKIEETKRNREILSNAPPEQEVEKEPEEAELLQDVKYEYHLGDKVYIGASEYEILSVDDERVMLYDYDVPLFNKEFSRTEFDRKVQENPMNKHLIVKEEPAEERKETEEVQTNMGSMPIEDYREIVASQSGFDSYDEMYHQGYRIGNGYDKKPEPVVPAWEQKKKSKALTYTLMCLWQTVTPLILEKMRLKRLVKRNASAEILWRYSFLKNVRKKTDLPLLKNRLSYQSMSVGVGFQKPLMKIIQRGQRNI